MHIAYSALRQWERPSTTLKNLSDRQLGYQAACFKHRQTIKEIQQYLPGWMPKPPIPKGE